MHILYDQKLKEKNRAFGNHFEFIWILSRCCPPWILAMNWPSEMSISSNQTVCITIKSVIRRRCNKVYCGWCDKHIKTRKSCIYFLWKSPKHPVTYFHVIRRNAFKENIESSQRGWMIHDLTCWSSICCTFEAFYDWNIISKDSSINAFMEVVYIDGKNIAFRSIVHESYDRFV